MIKDLAKFVVKDRRMNSAIESAEKHSDYLISLYESKLLIQLTASNITTLPNPDSIDMLNGYLQLIKDYNSRELLIIECSQLLLMNSLEEIL